MTSPDLRRRATTIAIILLRLIIGGVFIISGLSKAIDLWGTVYKVEEYLTVWDMTQPRSLVFMGALILSASEFVAGALTALGCCRRWAPIFLCAMMGVMLPLTLYIYIANPVSDCGCFGDFIILSNAATFWKNVAITLGIIALIKYNRRVVPFFSGYSQWVVITLLTAYVLVIGLYGYNIQPLIDFRSFPVGSTLLPSEDADADNADAPLLFIYEKDGERREFTLDEIPDSTWTYVDRVETAPSERNTTELVVYDADGLDATLDALADEGEEIILTIPSLARSEISWTYFLNELNKYMASRGGTMIAIVGGGEEAIRGWTDIAMASYPVFTAEPTTIKELARGNMALVYARDGVIEWKRSMAMMDTSLTDAMFEGSGPEAFAVDGTALFRSASLILILALIALYILDSTGRIVNWSIRRHRSSEKNS